MKALFDKLRLYIPKGPINAPVLDHLIEDDDPKRSLYVEDTANCIILTNKPMHQMLDLDGTKMNIDEPDYMLEIDRQNGVDVGEVYDGPNLSAICHIDDEEPLAAACGDVDTFTPWMERTVKQMRPEMEEWFTEMADSYLELPKSNDIHTAMAAAIASRVHQVQEETGYRQAVEIHVKKVIAERAFKTPIEGLQSEIDWIWANPQFYTSVEHRQLVITNVTMRYKCLRMIQRLEAALGTCGPYLEHLEGQKGKHTEIQDGK